MSESLIWVRLQSGTWWPALTVSSTHLSHEDRSDMFDIYDPCPDRRDLFTASLFTCDREVMLSFTGKYNIDDDHFINSSVSNQELSELSIYSLLYVMRHVQFIL